MASLEWYRLRWVLGSSVAVIGIGHREREEKELGHPPLQQSLPPLGQSIVVAAS